ncbi:MAG: site-2 protease family protein [Myxococcota bacterium]|nr:site-2 protease family protein [Myxococcota bacterium]MDW8361773.1 site-2 protease family protein [Myxococcales bacterium]
MALLWFVVLAGVLVLVHELGHFAAARLLGVRVLRVSVGFGPRLLGLRRGDTEYVLAAVPLGGYVRLLGEAPTDEVPDELRSRAFHSQPAWKRFAIIVAGPAMNFLLPLVLFFAVTLGRTDWAAPVVGTVVPGGPADGILRPGDRVLSVAGTPVSTFEQQRRIVERHAGVPIDLEIERDGQRRNVRIVPASVRVVLPLDRVRVVGRLGVSPYHPLAVVGVTGPDSPAAAAGLRTFDRVVSVAGRPVRRFADLEAALEQTRGRAVPLTVLRPERRVRALGGLADLEVYEPLVVLLAPGGGEGSVLARSGLELADLYVSDVVAGSIEHRIGLQRGDRIVALDGRPLRAWSELARELAAGAGREHELVWRREGRTMRARYRVEPPDGIVGGTLPAGIRHDLPVEVDGPVEPSGRVSWALSEAIRRTGELVELTLYSILRLFQGRVGVETIGGVITMVEYAGHAAREGPVNYLTLMAFLSVNLGVLNLVPLPPLDGGQLAFLGFEAIARRRPTIRARQIASIVGLVLLFALMLLALVNDIGRLWPAIAASGTGS